MKGKEPICHVVKRENPGTRGQIMAYFTGILTALTLGGVLLSLMGVPVLEFYGKMFTLGMIDNRFAYKSVENFIKVFVPLLMVSLALALAFRMRFWNIGGEGQFILGSICAGWTAMTVGDLLPRPLVLILMGLAGLVGGGLYGVGVAALKVRYGTNETLLTLMLNYIALSLLQFLGETKGSWNLLLDPNSPRPRFQTFPEGGQMMTFPLGKLSLPVTLVLALGLWMLFSLGLKHSKWGYELMVVGDSPSTAHYAGMNVGRIVLRTMLLSAGLIGLAGACYVSTAGALSTAVTNDVGWTGIVVAWLARLNTWGILICSAGITMLQYGVQAASTTYPSVDVNFADLLQGILLFSVLAADFFVRFRLVWRGGNQKEVQS